MNTNFESQIEAINWFHHFDKETFGFETRGEKATRNIDEIKVWGLVPELFKDKTVLDIGAWDGYNAFYAEKCGAKHVLAIDNPSWSGPSKGTKAGFDLAHKILDSQIDSLDINLYDITPEKIGTFDTVLLLGVLYHLTEPIDGLKKAAAVTNDLLIIETTCEYVNKEDALFIYKPEQFKNLKRSYYSPNRYRLEELFIDICGFSSVSIKEWENCKNSRVVCYARK